MAFALGKYPEKLFDSWAINLAEYFRGSPSYVALTSSTDGWRLANGEIVGDNDPSLSGQSLRFKVGHEDVAWASFPVPAAAEPHLPGIVSNKLSQISPWDSGTLIYGYDFDQGSIEEDGMRSVIVAMANAKAPLFNHGPLSTSSRKSAQSVVIEAISDKGQRITLNMPGIAGSSRDKSGVRQAKLALLTLAFVIVGGWIFSSLVNVWNDYKIDQLQQRQLAARQTLEPLRNKDDLTSSQTIVIGIRDSQPSRMMIFETLARTLPLSTYAETIEIDGSVLRFSGVTENAARVLSLVAEVDLFRDVKFAAPTVRERDGTRQIFEIEARIASDADALQSAETLFAKELAN